MVVVHPQHRRTLEALAARLAQQHVDTGGHMTQPQGTHTHTHTHGVKGHELTLGELAITHETRLPTSSAADISAERRRAVLLHPHSSL